MSVEQIKSRLQSGFHPFTIHLSDGRGFLVPHRDFIALHPKTVVVIDPEGISHTINPLHIVSIDEAVREE
jgi:hypothetical protein